MDLFTTLFGRGEKSAARRPVSLTLEGLGERALPSAGLTTPATVFEVEDYSFNIEQTLNIGSQPSGVGGGKITFNPFSIDKATVPAQPPTGTPAPTNQNPAPYLQYGFPQGSVTSIEWSGSGGETPEETITVVETHMVLVG